MIGNHAARRFVHQHLAAADAGSEALFVAVLVATELVTYAARQAGTSVELGVTRRNHRIRVVEARDGSPERPTLPDVDTEPPPWPAAH